MPINPLHSSKSVEWMTPPHVIKLARAVMGDIDLDPASSKQANATIGAKRFFERKDDGLTQDWSGRVWLNPPYGRGGQSLWSEKMFREYESGRVAECIGLFNASTGAKWFEPFWNFHLCFPRRRIAFSSPVSGETQHPTHSNAIIYLGDDWQKFKSEFEKLGHIVKP